MYNGQGDRVQQTVDGFTNNYILDLTNSLPQVLDDGNNTYLYGLGRIGVDTKNGWQYYLTDALGSVRQATNQLNVVTLAQNYAPFGAVTSSAGSSDSFGFTSEQSDWTGLIYLRARYYDPTTGRFINCDSYAGTLTNPASQHRYTYTENNPVNYTDPSGKCPLCFALVIGGVTVTLTAGEVILLAGATALAINALLPGAKERNEVFASSMQSATNQLLKCIRSYFARHDYIPPGLSQAERNAYREAIHRYKKAYGLSSTHDTPKWILDNIGELIKKGVKPVDIPDEAPAPPEEDDNEDD